MRRLRSLLAVGLFGLAMTAATHASAQTPGLYLGLNSDGYQVTVNVYQDPAGKLFLTLVRNVAPVYCSGKLLLTQGKPVPYGAALLTQVPITNGVVTFAGRSNGIGAITGTVTFDGDTARGRLVGYSALFSGSTLPPNDNEAKSCRTRDLHFQAKRSGPA